MSNFLTICGKDELLSFILLVVLALGGAVCKYAKNTRNSYEDARNVEKNKLYKHLDAEHDFNISFVKESL